jgi:hypothetical protein
LQTAVSINELLCQSRVAPGKHRRSSSVPGFKPFGLSLLGAIRSGGAGDPQPDEPPGGILDRRAIACDKSLSHVQNDFHIGQHIG